MLDDDSLFCGPPSVKVLPSRLDDLERGPFVIYSSIDYYFGNVPDHLVDYDRYVVLGNYRHLTHRVAPSKCQWMTSLDTDTILHLCRRACTGYRVLFISSPGSLLLRRVCDLVCCYFVPHYHRDYFDRWDVYWNFRYWWFRSKHCRRI